MTVYLTSDTHFGHKRILGLYPTTRPYTSVDEMNAQLVKQWNQQIKHTDLVYHLGDISLTNFETTMKILYQLNGRKILIRGNHDLKFIRDSRGKHEFISLFESVHDIYELNYKNQTIVMCHYPLLSWNKMYYGSIHCHGHCHGNITGLESKKAFDVGIDSTKQIAVTLDSIIFQAESRSNP